jgi:hypothetical protein
MKNRKDSFSFGKGWKIGRLRWQLLSQISKSYLELCQITARRTSQRRQFYDFFLSLPTQIRKK